MTLSQQVLRRRKAAGRYVQQLRLSSEKTQSQLTDTLGYGYFTTISAIENGRMRMPFHIMEAYAMALDVDPRDFMMKMLEFYEPDVHRVLFRDHQTAKFQQRYSDEIVELAEASTALDPEDLARVQAFVSALHTISKP